MRSNALGKRLLPILVPAIAFAPSEMPSCAVEALFGSVGVTGLNDDPWISATSERVSPSLSGSISSGTPL